MIVVSVIICTHNPRTDYLTRVLTALRAQTLPPEQWELLIIDNASKDPVARRFDVSWHPHGRHVREDELGLTPARLRGIAEAQAELLVFVDDDNVLDPDYLEQAVRIGEGYPFIGAWGGQIRPEFETEPPEWSKPYWPMLALVEVKSSCWSNLTDSLRTAPCGAGMCVRTAIARVYATQCRQSRLGIQLGRKGQSLASCEDSAMALTACDLGYGTGLFPQLTMMHIIPSSRISLSYLEKLAEEMTFSGELLWATRGRVVPPSSPQKIITRLIDRYHRFRLSPPDRAILEARRRGQERANMYIREMQ